MGTAVIHHSDNIASYWCPSVHVCAHVKVMPLSPCNQMFASLGRQIVRYLVACACSWLSRLLQHRSLQNL